jgi:hypothetical protein
VTDGHDSQASEPAAAQPETHTRTSTTAERTRRL